MNYEAETKKTSNGKLRSSFYWIFYNSNYEARETVRTICIMSTVLAAIITAQLLMVGTVKEQISEWETSMISKWNVVGKFVDDTYRDKIYYLALQDSKYKWAKEVSNVGYNITNVGSTVSVEYTKSDLFPENKPEYLAVIGFVSLAIQTLLLIAVFCNVADFFEKGYTDYSRFRSWIMSENNRVGVDDPRIQKQFDLYVTRYDLIKGIVVTLMIGYSTWCVYYLILTCKLA